jgi:putative endonuclease
MIRGDLKKLFFDKKILQKKYWAWIHGHVAEYLALFYFYFQGYRLHSRRFKCPVGEIDLIVSKGTQLVFVEVKFRQNMYDGAHAITFRQRKRLLNAAKFFLMKSSIKIDQEIRFDVILINRYYRLKHIYAAFEDEY